jgi:hypothetical protein
MIMGYFSSLKQVISLLKNSLPLKTRVLFRVSFPLEENWKQKRWK